LKLVGDPLPVASLRKSVKSHLDWVSPAVRRRVYGLLAETVIE